MTNHKTEIYELLLSRSVGAASCFSITMEIELKAVEKLGLETSWHTALENEIPAN